jgi:two-component system KDP operon response regulator KdpE
VDLAARRVMVRDGDRVVDVRLTPTEWHLLEVLLRHPGKLLSPNQLLKEVWGPGYETAGGNLRVYMAKLRRKVEADPARPRHPVTEPGMGYRFQPEEKGAGLRRARQRRWSMRRSTPRSPNSRTSPVTSRVSARN